MRIFKQSLVSRLIIVRLYGDNLVSTVLCYSFLQGRVEEEEPWERLWNWGDFVPNYTMGLSGRAIAYLVSYYKVEQNLGPNPSPKNRPIGQFGSTTTQSRVQPLSSQSFFTFWRKLRDKMAADLSPVVFAWRARRGQRVVGREKISLSRSPALSSFPSHPAHHLGEAVRVDWRRVRDGWW